jgi:hypothetical protein
MKCKLTKKEQAIIANLNPKCEDCRHYKNEESDVMMCFHAAPFIAYKETQRLKENCFPRNMNCGIKGRWFQPKNMKGTKDE